jgi:hypothetical protein
LLLNTIAFSQTNGKVVGNGVIWTDSLGWNVTDTTGLLSDSVFIINTDFTHEWYKIFVEGNANSTVDTIGVTTGSIRYNQYGSPVDTVWGSAKTLKDSVWNSINLIVNNATGKDFLIFDPAIQLLRFSLLNYREALLTRNVVITINAKSK